MPFHPNYPVTEERQAYTLKGGRVGCLVLHGFLGSPASSKPLASYLSKRGITVHCPLLPGHGELPNKLVGADRDAWLDEAAEGLDTIMELCDQIFLIGHSMGTILCAYLASLNAAVKGVVLFAPLDRLPDRRLHGFRVLRYFKPWLYPLNYSDLEEIVIDRLHDYDPSLDMQDPNIKSQLPELTRVPTAAIDEMRKTVAMGRRLWPKLSCPAAIFQGGADPASKPDGAQRVFEMLPVSDKEFHDFETAGHELFRPSDPNHKEIWPQVYDFISNRSSLDKR